jgi:hypothetical protein
MLQLIMCNLQMAAAGVLVGVPHAATMQLAHKILSLADLAAIK